MKKLIVFALCLMGVMSSSAQQKSITVSQVGSLASSIGKEKLTITSLKITGDLNGSDIKLLREMCGADSKGKLADLDLSSANILAGGDCYFPLGKEQDSYTENDAISTKMFYGCTSLRTITLPNTVQSVSNDAFSYCPNLVSFKIDGNKSFRVIDDILYTADSTTLVRCPQGKKLVKADIFEGVKQIYPSAFRGVKTLTEVSLPSTLEGISDVAFYGCPSIKVIKSAAVNPPFMEASFDQSVLNTATVYVRPGAASEYNSVDGWNTFKKIVER